MLGCLREIRTDELSLMLSWRNAPEVRSNMYTRQIIELDDHLAWWNRIEHSQTDLYRMFETDDGTPSGIVAFNHIDQQNRTAAWAYYAAPDCAAGTGATMEFLALEMAFSELSLAALNCEVLGFNSAVVRLHEKFGFVVDEVLESHHEYDGRFVDVVRLVLASKKWAEIREKMRIRLERAASRKG